MNLSVKFSGLVFTSALFLFSCKKDINNISLNEKPQLGVFFNDSLEIETEVVLIDSLQSSSDKDMLNTAMFVGNFKDDKFGNVTAESYTSIERSSTADLSGAKVVSGFISLYTNYSYGEANLDNQSFPIYEITSPFPKSKYTTKDGNKVSSGGQVLGVLTHDKVNTQAKRFIADLDPAFTERLLFDTVSSDFNERVVKGIHIKPGSDGIGINRFDANNALSYINIRYATGPNYQDTLDYRFVFGSDSTKFYTITTDYSGSALEKITNRPIVNGKERVVSSTELFDKAYLQAGTGLMVRVTIKGLKEFINKIGPNALINGAELVVPFDDTDESAFAKSSLNLLYRRDGNYFKYGYVNFLQENKDQRGAPMAVFPIENKYRFIVTNYIKSIVRGTEPYPDLLLFPFDNTNTFTLNRVVFNTNTEESKPFKLNIYYTK